MSQPSAAASRITPQSSAQSGQVSDGTAIAPARGQTVVWLGAVSGVLLVVAVTMRLVTVWRTAPYVPLWADQVQDLTEAYLLPLPERLARRPFESGIMAVM